MSSVCWRGDDFVGESLRGLLRLSQLGEGFQRLNSYWEIILWEGLCGDFSLPLAANVCGIAKNIWLYVTLCWDWRSIPQVMEMETCPWLLCTSWKISWNLDLTSPDVLDSGMSCPLRRFVNGSVIPFEVILFTERAFIHWIFVVWIFLPFEQLTMCEQCYLKNAKVMSVLKYFF